jgi:hypothetical protein
MKLSDADYLRLLQAIALDQLIVRSVCSTAHWPPGARLPRRPITRPSCGAATTDANARTGLKATTRQARGSSLD